MSNKAYACSVIVFICRLHRMEEAASGTERRHIALLLRPLTEAIDMALTKHEAAKADALTSQA